MRYKDLAAIRQKKQAQADKHKADKLANKPLKESGKVVSEARRNEIYDKWITELERKAKIPTKYYEVIRYIEAPNGRKFVKDCIKTDYELEPIVDLTPQQITGIKNKFAQLDAIDGFTTDVVCYDEV